MQTLNKDLVKRKLVYTWYFYPVVLGASLLLWIWGYKAFHQPTDIEKITMFVGANVKDISFTKPIIEQHKDKGMRDFEVPSCAPSRGVYAQKLNLYLSTSDLFILPESTLNELTSRDDGSAAFMKDYFRPFISEIKDTYLSSSCSYYTFTDKTESKDIDYGVLVKAKEEKCFLSDYVEFDENENYYMLISTTSKNTGDLFEGGNANYTNALTSMQYIVLGGSK